MRKKGYFWNFVEVFINFNSKSSFKILIFAWKTKNKENNLLFIGHLFRNYLFELIFELCFKPLLQFQ